MDQPTAYVPGQYPPASTTVQQHVHGESTNVSHGYVQMERVEPVTQVQAPEAPPERTEEPLTASLAPAENVDLCPIEPVPTAQQRQWSAPHMEWDATRLGNSFSFLLVTA